MAILEGIYTTAGRTLSAQRRAANSKVTPTLAKLGNTNRASSAATTDVSGPFSPVKEISNPPIFFSGGSVATVQLHLPAVSTAYDVKEIVIFDGSTAIADLAVATGNIVSVPANVDFLYPVFLSGTEDDISTLTVTNLIIAAEATTDMLGLTYKGGKGKLLATMDLAASGTFTGTLGAGVPSGLSIENNPGSHANVWAQLVMTALFDEQVAGLWLELESGGAVVYRTPYTLNPGSAAGSTPTVNLSKGAGSSTYVQIYGSNPSTTFRYKYQIDRKSAANWVSGDELKIYEWRA